MSPGAWPKASRGTGSTSGSPGALAGPAIRRTDPATAPHPVAPTGVVSNDSVEAAVASFLELHAYRKTRLNSAKSTEYSFNRFVLPAWRGRKVADIARREIIDLVESVAADTPYAGNRLLAALSKFFSWLVARDVIAMSPAAGVERPHREVARERVLDDDELRRLWRACEDEGPFGAALRLMILTGTRRNEVSAMPWEELHENRQLWLLPAERTKNDRPHAIPLPTQARAIIESRPQINGSAFVFTIDGRRPIVGWAKVKREISIKAGLNPKSWRLHDLRRTCASGMQRLGTPVPVVEKALNHVSGTFRGIVATYQRHTYAEEIRVALQAWADHVEELVSGRKSSKVVRIRKMK